MTNQQILIAAGAYEGIILGFQLNLSAATPTITLTFTEKTHTASVKAVKFSGNVLLSGSSDENVHIFDVGRRRFLGALHFPEGEIGTIETFECEEASVGSDGASQVKRVQYALVADGDLRMTVLRVRAQRLAIGSVQTYKRAAKPGDSRKRAQAAPFSAIAVHPSNKLILAVSNSRKQLYTFSFDATATCANRKPMKLEHTLPLHREPISVRWNESGTRYALALRASRNEIMQGDELRIFNVSDGQECARLRTAARLTSFEWLMGERLVAACADGTLRVYRLLEGASEPEMEKESNSPTDDKPHGAVSECEWRVGDSRVKAISVLRADPSQPSSLITCVCSDGLVSVLNASEVQNDTNVSKLQFSNLCSFKSVFRFTCVAAGIINPRVPIRNAVDAPAEAQLAPVSDDDDKLAEAELEVEEKEKERTDTEVVKRSIVELATRNQPDSRRRSNANQQRKDGKGGSASGGKSKKRKFNKNETKKTNAKPRHTQMSKLEKKVRKWTAPDGLGAAKAKTKSAPTDRSQFKKGEAKRVKTTNE